MNRSIFMPAKHLGNAASVKAGRTRALRTFRDIGPCASCGSYLSERHHIDGNTLNNDPINIAVLCRKCHMVADGRAAALSVLSVSRIGELQAIAAQKKRDKTTCKNGHELTGDNLYVAKSQRVCRTCMRVYQKRYQEKKCLTRRSSQDKTGN